MPPTHMRIFRFLPLFFAFFIPSLRAEELPSWTPGQQQVLKIAEAVGPYFEYQNGPYAQWVTAIPLEFLNPEMQIIVKKSLEKRLERNQALGGDSADIDRIYELRDDTRPSRPLLGYVVSIEDIHYFDVDPPSGVRLYLGTQGEWLKSMEWEL